jgi:hypothetical protein
MGATGTTVMGGSKTLRKICLREWSWTFFFFRFKFCAIDSVHLNPREQPITARSFLEAHRLNALSNLPRSIWPGRGTRRGPRVGWMGDEPCKLESPTSVSSSTDCESG